MKTDIARIGARDVEYLYLNGKLGTIVLVNGSGGPLISWLGIIGELSAQYNVLAYNRPGVAKSSRPQTPQTATQMALELNELISFLSIEGPLVLVGHSLGGLVVLAFCLSFPNAVKGIVLLEPSTFWDIDSQKSLPVDTRQPQSELNFVRPSAEALRDLSPLSKVRAVVGIGTKNSLLYYLFLARFEKRRTNLRRLAQEFRNSAVYEFTKSGHFPQMSEAKNVADLIKNECKNLFSLNL